MCSSIFLLTVCSFYLQAVLSEFLGKKVLDRHLDADEAVSLGASLHAANLSDRVKLNRKFGMIDAAPYTIVLKVEGGRSILEETDAEQILIPRLKKVPSKVGPNDV
jgi:hypoxia up-regulated 1